MNSIEDVMPSIPPEGADEATIGVIAALNTNMDCIASLHQICELRAETLEDEGRIKRMMGWHKTKTMRKDVAFKWRTYLKMRDCIMKHIVENTEESK